MLPVRALTARYTPAHTRALTKPNSLMAITLALTRANMLTAASANTITFALTGTFQRHSITRHATVSRRTTIHPTITSTRALLRYTSREIHSSDSRTTLTLSPTAVPTITTARTLSRISGRTTLTTRYTRGRRRLHSQLTPTPHPLQIIQRPSPKQILSQSIIITRRGKLNNRIPITKLTPHRNTANHLLLHTKLIPQPRHHLIHPHLRLTTSNKRKLNHNRSTTTPIRIRNLKSRKRLSRHRSTHQHLIRVTIKKLHITRHTRQTNIRIPSKTHRINPHTSPEMVKPVKRILNSRIKPTPTQRRTNRTILSNPTNMLLKNHLNRENPQRPLTPSIRATLPSPLRQLKKLLISLPRTRTSHQPITQQRKNIIHQKPHPPQT